MSIKDADSLPESTAENIRRFQRRAKKLVQWPASRLRRYIGYIKRCLKYVGPFIMVPYLLLFGLDFLGKALAPQKGVNPVIVLALTPHYIVTGALAHKVPALVFCAIVSFRQLVGIPFAYWFARRIREVTGEIAQEEKAKEPGIIRNAIRWLAGLWLVRAVCKAASWLGRRRLCRWWKNLGQQSVLGAIVVFGLFPMFNPAGLVFGPAGSPVTLAAAARTPLWKVLLVSIPVVLVNTVMICAVGSGVAALLS